MEILMRATTETTRKTFVALVLKSFCGFLFWVGVLALVKTAWAWLPKFAYLFA